MIFWPFYLSIFEISISDENMALNKYGFGWHDAFETRLTNTRRHLVA